MYNLTKCNLILTSTAAYLKKVKLRNLQKLSYLQKSELDFLEWSPLNDRNLMPDDWTTDTLFSAINVPFPFPDSREIGAYYQKKKLLLHRQSLMLIIS